MRLIHHTQLGAQHCLKCKSYITILYVKYHRDNMLTYHEHPLYISFQRCTAISIELQLIDSFCRSTMPLSALRFLKDAL